MTEHGPSWPIEDKLRAALAAPEPDPAFMERLEQDLQAAPISRPPNRPPASWLRRPAWAISLALGLLLLGVLLAVGPRRVAAAVRGLLGYLPGFGYVEQGASLRVLAEPLEQEREGVTVTVEQVVADPQQTVVVFTVDGLTQQHRPASEDAPFCSDSPVLRLPDGQELTQSGGEGSGWPGGYRTRAVFPALPAGLDRGGSSLRLVLPCLFDTRPGAAPENWEFSLALQPAPPDFQLRTVIELPTTVPPTALAPAAPLEVLPPTPDLHGIRFTVEKLVELEDGFLLQGSLDWQGTKVTMPGFNPYFLQVSDGAGQTVPVEPAQTEQTAAEDPYTQQRSTWTIRTASRQYASPLTLTLPALSIDQQVEVPFELDLGSAPQPGQVWEVNQTLTVAGRELTLQTVRLEAPPDGNPGAYGLFFLIQADPSELTSASLWDPDNHSARIATSGGSDQHGSIQQSIYYDYLPAGLRRFVINQASYPLTGPWTATVELPASSIAGGPAPTQPVACLSPDSLAQVQPAPLPAGLAGRLLLGGPAQEGVHFPTLYVANLDGSDRVTIGPGGWADLSPDAKRVVFTNAAGMNLADLETGQSGPLAWAQENDYGPLWSPDGAWLAFVRSGEGIYLAHPDGSELHKAPGTDSATTLTGWLPDGNGLVVSQMGADGTLLQTLDLVTGAAAGRFTIANSKGGFGRLSPTGQRLVFLERVFGQPAYGVYLSNLDGSDKRLVASLGTVSVSAPAWSPDGSWLLLTASEPTLEDTHRTHYLVRPDTCELIPLTWTTDSIIAWR